MKRKILFSFLPVTPQVKLRPVAMVYYYYYYYLKTFSIAAKG